MLRGYVLSYLALVATGATPEEAAASAPGALRALVMRGVRRALIAASFDTAHADDAAHVHRLAYLHVLGSRLVDASDVEGTRRLFETARRPELEKRAWLRVVAGLSAVLLVAGAGAGAWVFLSRPPPRPPEPSSAAPSETPEPPGEPAHPLTPFFEQTLPDYVVALDAATAGRERPAPDDVASARARVLAALEQGRPALVPTMTGLLDAAEHYATGDGDDDVGLWFNRLVLFHDALEADDVPFYVDADLTESRRTGRKRVLLSSYRVLSRRTFTAGEERVRALDLERLDSLNFERSLLGYTRPEVRYALVLTDKIERFLIEDLLPSVHSANESVIVRGYEDEAGVEWVTTFEEHAHEDLRAESERIALQALGSTRALDELAAAIVARRNAVVAMNSALRASGVRVREPAEYDYDVAAIASLGARAGGTSLADVRAADRTLRSAPVLAAYRALHAAIALSIAEHEVQHRLDYQAGSIRTVPEVLRQYVGETESEDRVNRRAERSNAELSAYLSQIAQRPSLARTSLIHVASFLMNRNAWGMPESYAAIALFEALAAEAGITHGELIQRRRIVRGEAARIYGELRARGPEALSELARRAWQRLYGAELPVIREAG